MYFLSQSICLFQTFQINEIIHYVTFLVKVFYFTWHNAFKSYSCFSMCQYLILFIDKSKISLSGACHILFVHSLADEYLVSFNIILLLCMYICAQFISLGYIQSGTFGSYGHSMFNFLSNWHKYRGV